MGEWRVGWMERLRFSRVKISFYIPFYFEKYGKRDDFLEGIPRLV